MSFVHFYRGPWLVPSHYQTHRRTGTILSVYKEILGRRRRRGRRRALTLKQNLHFPASSSVWCTYFDIALNWNLHWLGFIFLLHPWGGTYCYLTQLNAFEYYTYSHSIYSKEVEGLGTKVHSLSKKFCTRILFSLTDSWCQLWLDWKGLVRRILFS